MKRSAFSYGALLAMVCLVPGCSPSPQVKQAAGGQPTEPNAERAAPANMFRVFPVSADSAAPAANLRIGQGQFFSYALPQGWRIGEDGQFAMTLVAPDNKAFTVMVGNAGYPPNYPPGQFVHEKLTALQPQNLQLSQPRRSTPISGFATAYEFDVIYSIRGVPSRGLVKCHIATAYDSAVLVMTAALSEATQWDGYATWLPLVAEQISATNGAAFGKRGIMAQNLQNSTAYAEAARQYRDWSQRNWQQVTDGRNASVDRRNREFRETLGAVQTYNNPFGHSAPVELPTTYQYYWTDPQGNFLGTDDPSVNPNNGSTIEWRKMQRRKQ
jgi:hypothetical protein